MTIATPPTNARRARALRLILPGSLAALLLAVGSVFNPFGSSAGNAPSQDAIATGEAEYSSLVGPDSLQPAASSNDAADDARDNPARSPAALLGMLESDRYNVRIEAGEHGVLYTVTDAQGVVLAERASADDVYRAVPDFDVRTLRAQTMGEADDPLPLPDELNIR